MSSSKFRNAIGADKKEKFTNCSVTTVSTEGRLIAVNGKFLAMSWSNAGEVVVVDSSSPFSIKPDQPRIKGHRANVLDLEFSPFSSDLLACSFDDYSVLLYKIPEGGLTEHMTQEVQIYQKHSKKVPFVTFNPVASDVVCSGAFLGEIHVWNAVKGEAFAELKADDTPTLVSWNPNGTLIGATTKNKFINIFDPRANKKILKHQINEAFQSAKFAWIDNQTIATTSWSKTGAKMLKLWDIRKVKEDLTSEGEVTGVQIDTSKTVTTPFVDRESKLLYAVGKGESSIHIYDYNEGTFRKGINFSSAEPSICSILFDRKCLDYNTLEVDRFARYVNSQKVYYVSFTLPRRNPGFDPTLYPPVVCGEAALSYDQWIGGEIAEPIKKEINTIENKFVSKVEVFVKQEVKVEKKKPEDKIKELEGKIAEISVKINQINQENAKLKKQIESKKVKKEEQQPELPKPIEHHEEQKEQKTEIKIVEQQEEPKADQTEEPIPDEQNEEPMAEQTEELKIVEQKEEPMAEKVEELKIVEQPVEQKVDQTEEIKIVEQQEEPKADQNEEPNPDEQNEEPQPEEMAENPQLEIKLEEPQQ
jgi:hypothetical protein